MNKEHHHKIYLSLKYLMDIIIAVILTVMLSPILLIISLSIRIESSGPSIFKQQRVGLNGKLFFVYKFRTMVINAENIGLGYKIINNDPRITKVGKFLRSWSLDELPQLFNIIKGEMSFIGPRPTLMYQVAAYTPEQRKRLYMKPGITGLAQVNGRNSIPWEKRIEFDIRYVENWSLWLDIKIVAKTCIIIFKKESVYNKNEVSYDLSGVQHDGQAKK